MSFYEVRPGSKVNGGSGPPLASDVNQYAKGFDGREDVGRIALAPKVLAPNSPGVGMTSAGSELEVGTYVYSMTFVTGHVRGDGTMDIRGETDESATWVVVTFAGNRRVALSSLPIPTDTTVIGKRLYRTEVDGTQRKLVTTLTANVTTYLDVVPDGNLGSDAPTQNSTGTYVDDRRSKQRILSKMIFGM